MEKPDVTVTITHEEWVQLTNLLQLMTVCGVKLHMQGMPGPKIEALRSVFEKLADAGFNRQQPNTSGAEPEQCGQCGAIIEGVHACQNDV